MLKSLNHQDLLLLFEITRFSLVNESIGLKFHKILIFIKVNIPRNEYCHIQISRVARNYVNTGRRKYTKSTPIFFVLPRVVRHPTTKIMNHTSRFIYS